MNRITPSKKGLLYQKCHSRFFFPGHVYLADEKACLTLRRAPAAHGFLDGVLV